MVRYEITPADATAVNNKHADLSYTVAYEDSNKWYIDLYTIYRIGYHVFNKTAQSVWGMDWVEKFNLPSALIWNYLPKDQNPFYQDFTHLGLTKESPTYDRGYKVSARYLAADGKPVVQKDFIRVIGDRVRNIGGQNVTVPNSLLRIDGNFKWLDSAGNVAFSKVETMKTYSVEEEANRQYKENHAAINWLKGRAKGTLIEPALTLLFARYNAELNKWYEENTPALSAAILLDMVTQTPTTLPDTTGLEPIAAALQKDITTLTYTDLVKFPLPNLDGTYTLVGDDVLYQISYHANVVKYTAAQLGLA